MTRYLRQNTGDVWIWTPQLAARPDMVEVYALNVDDAKKALPITEHDRIIPSQLHEMTKAMLMGYAWDRFTLRLNPSLKHEELVELIEEQIAKTRADAEAANVAPYAGQPATQ